MPSMDDALAFQRILPATVELFEGVMIDVETLFAACAAGAIAARHAIIVVSVRAHLRRDFDELFVFIARPYRRCLSGT